LRDHSLDELVTETLHKVELVLENGQTEKDFTVLELTSAELHFTDTADFFQDRLDLAL
jgi:hypothetical protein